MGGIIMIVTNVKLLKIAHVLLFNSVNVSIGGDAIFFGTEHDGRAMGVIRAHVITGMAQVFLKPNKDIGLNVFHQMPQMNVPIGIGQGTGYKQGFGHASTVQFQGVWRQLRAVKWGMGNE
jgi:hypothetical protein